MTRRTTGKRRRLVIIAVIILVLAAAGYGGYLLYNKFSDKSIAVPANIKAAAQKSVQSTNIAGNQDLATLYVSYLKMGNTQAAQKLFSDKVAATSDVPTKIDLWTQNVMLAIANNAPDQALAAAQSAVATQATDATYALEAQAYIAKGDVTDATTYWQKALTYVQASDSPYKAQLVALYQSSIASAKNAPTLFKGPNE